jgi:hypothetical protein
MLLEKENSFHIRARLQLIQALSEKVSHTLTADFARYLKDNYVLQTHVSKTLYILMKCVENTLAIYPAWNDLDKYPILYTAT